jgi:autotransporter translocation and assembly factor TamB
VRRAVILVARSAGTAAVFVGAVVGGALLHLNLPAVRRAVVARVDAVLATVVQGRIVIERVGELGPAHVRGVDARVDDPEGRTVIRVFGVAGRVAPLPLLRSLVTGEDIVVSIDELSVPKADVSLDADDSGTLRLVRAFASRSPSAPSTPGSRGVRLSIPRGQLVHASVHGRPPGAPALDVDVDGAEAGVRVAPGQLELTAAHARLLGRDLPPGLRTQGTLDARYAQPAPGGGDRLVQASWRGGVGELAATADARYDRGRVDAVVDVPAARPECVRALWAECPFAESAAAHAEVHGELPRLWVTARTGVGPGMVTATGSALVGDEVRAALHVTATTVDARALVFTAPTTELDAAADVALLRTRDGTIGSVVALDFDGGLVGPVPVPAAALVGQMTRDAAGALRAQANVAAREPGVPAKATVSLAPAGDSYALAFDATADVPRLDGVPRLGPVARGSAQARAHGTVDLGSKHVDAQVVATAAGVQAGAARVGSLTLTARASGTTDGPRIDADLAATDLSAGALLFERLHADAHGTTAGAPVHVTMQGHKADIEASANVALKNAVSLRDLVVAVQRNGEIAHAHASTVLFASREVRIEELAIDGLGAPLYASVRASPSELQVQARSHGLDVARIGRLAGVERLGGRLSLDVDATLQPHTARGRLLLDLTQGSFGDWTDATAHVDATLDDRHAGGTISARLGDVASLDVRSSSIELGPAGPLVPASWRSAWGSADVTSHIDLAKLSAHLPKNTLPSVKLSGAIDLQARVGRDSASDSTPDVDVTLRSSDLAIVGSPVPWRVDGLGASLHATVDGRTGVTTVEAQATDHTGVLASVTGSSDAVPYARIFEPDAPLADALLTMPFRATLTVPPRDVATLPAALGVGGAAGILDARVDWVGAADKPAIDVRAGLKHAHSEATGLSVPLDLDLGAHYDGAHGSAELRAVVRDQPVLGLQGDVDVRAADVMRGNAAWKGSASAKLSGFPLQSIAALDDRQVRGRLSGTMKLDGLHDDARATLAMTLDDLHVGDVACGPTTLSARFDGSSLVASGHVAAQDGFADARVQLGARWGAALGPSVDASSPADVTLSARHFRIAVLRPLFSRLFTELDGRVDANAHFAVDPTKKTFVPDGTIALTEGVFELGAIGNELHDATARIRFTPDGLVTLEEASAKGLSGRVEAAATARLRGFDLVGARGVVRVPNREPLPLVVSGTQVGTFDGRIEVEVDRLASGTDVKVDVPTMRLVLPLESKHDVQELGPLTGVRTGVARGSGGFAESALDAGESEEQSSGGPQSPMRIAVQLGKDVVVKRGTQLNVHLEGGPTVTVGQRVTATGQVRLKQGTLDVQGKQFTIDEGTVTFVDDPTNPQVVLTASWQAQDSRNTVVFADFIGPLKTAKVRLRSQPSMSPDEIASLLLYGTPDQSMGGSGTAGNSQVGAAQGAAGSAASQNVNRALGGVNSALESLRVPVGIATNVDTSQTTPRPEVEVQIARDISLQVAYVLGLPPPGANPDTLLLTIGYRFLRKWKLNTTVGNQGSTILDVVWQHRY